MPRGIRQTPDPAACRSLRRRGHVVLTPLALAVLAAVGRLTRGRGFPPTIRDVARELGRAHHNALTDALIVLRRAGLLAMRHGARSLVVTCRWLPERPAAASGGGVTL